MSRRIKITLPDPLVAQLEALAEERGEPTSRVAAQLCSLRSRSEQASNLERRSCPQSVPQRTPTRIVTRRGSNRYSTRGVAQLDVGLDRRVVRPLSADAGAPERGLVGGQSHLETLCALVVWRDWIDQAADDPRHELAFQTQLGDYGHLLRQEGGGVTQLWKPGPAPTAWIPNQNPIIAVGEPS